MAVELLRIEGLHKSFGRLEVLRGIDLAVDEHGVVCMIGASGSGKSTLLRSINLLEPVDEGRILLAGEEITAPGVEVNRVRQGIGIVFQAFNLFPHMTVLRNVTLAPIKALGKAKTEAVAEAGRMRPARVSVSSETGWMTTYSSSGSSVTSTLRDSSITS